MISFRRNIGLVTFFVSLAGIAVGAERDLTVAVSLDIPPYVMTNAASGAEVDLVRLTLSNRKVKWVQMDYDQLENAVSEKKADVAMSVHENRKGVFYSSDYVGFVNFAISKQADHLKIKTVGDLKGHRVLTWQNAWMQLGDAFKTQYAPEAGERKNYVEFPNQAEQVRQFWSGANQVIVIDRSIFDYFSRQMGHSVDEVEYWTLFPKVTKFRAAFADAKVRDEFNTKLKEICASGEYARLLKRYEMPDAANICHDAK